jgi:hypothetical protein
VKLRIRNGDTVNTAIPEMACYTRHMILLLTRFSVPNLDPRSDLAEARLPEDIPQYMPDRRIFTKSKALGLVTRS